MYLRTYPNTYFNEGTVVKTNKNMMFNLKYEM